MAELQNYILEIGLVIGLLVTIVFILALIRKDNSLADVFWGLGFVIVAIYSLVQSGEIDLRKAIVSVLVSLWGFRLAVHIMTRNKGKGEDFRYAAWRRTWKFFYLRSYIQVFLLQGFLMLVISSPIWFINFSKGGALGVWDSLGLMLFGVGFFIEAIADYQLSEFKKNPAHKGQIMTTGLWSVSRHPNYFGEALVWWGLACYAMSMQGGAWVFLSPVVITFLLRFVSGVPMLEKRVQSYPGWMEYKSRTAPFIPFVRFF